MIADESIRPTIAIDGKTLRRSHDDRYYVLAKVPSDFAVKEQWPSVKAVGMAVRVTETRDGTTTGAVRYFITSRYLSGSRFAISLLKRHPSKHSIKGKSQIAGWNNEFLMEVLTRHKGLNVRWPWPGCPPPLKGLSIYSPARGGSGRALSGSRRWTIRQISSCHRVSTGLRLIELLNPAKTDRFTRARAL